MGNCCSAADEYTLLDDGRTGRHQYGTTRHGGGHRDSEAEGGLAQIFWDVENCGIPSGINPAVVVQKLRALRTSRGYAPSGIVATVASNHLSLATREALVASGVDVLDSTSTKPSAADFLLLEEIQKWTFHHPPNCYGVM
ncbi:hypothetical protein CALCODRAFT_194353 [Calocera cornea HHB12733]|uniref:NYN domain-containing protein n=1 Tax=Calocera cornea HHB12733 TaxID=1353952 RepID=A0A165HHU0_9BASI|nr:hypothetical protein CALCODRAFT_194353 [Calocera cornea HHB12733]